MPKLTTEQKAEIYKYLDEKQAVGFADKISHLVELIQELQSLDFLKSNLSEEDATDLFMGLAAYAYQQNLITVVPILFTYSVGFEHLITLFVEGELKKDTLTICKKVGANLKEKIKTGKLSEHLSNAWSDLKDSKKQSALEDLLNAHIALTDNDGDTFPDPKHYQPHGIASDIPVASTSVSAPGSPVASIGGAGAMPVPSEDLFSSSKNAAATVQQPTKRTSTSKAKRKVKNQQNLQHAAANGPGLWQILLLIVTGLAAVYQPLRESSPEKLALPGSDGNFTGNLTTYGYSGAGALQWPVLSPSYGAYTDFAMARLLTNAAVASRQADLVAGPHNALQVVTSEALFHMESATGEIHLNSEPPVSMTPVSVDGDFHLPAAVIAADSLKQLEAAAVVSRAEAAFDDGIGSDPVAEFKRLSRALGIDAHEEVVDTAELVAGAHNALVATGAPQPHTVESVRSVIEIEEVPVVDDDLEKSTNLLTSAGRYSAVAPEPSELSSAVMAHDTAELVAGPHNALVAIGASQSHIVESAGRAAEVEEVPVVDKVASSDLPAADAQLDTIAAPAQSAVADSNKTASLQPVCPIPYSRDGVSAGASNPDSNASAAASAVASVLPKFTLPANSSAAGATGSAPAPSVSPLPAQDSAGDRPCPPEPSADSPATGMAATAVAASLLTVGGMTASTGSDSAKSKKEFEFNEAWLADNVLTKARDYTNVTIQGQQLHFTRAGKDYSVSAYEYATPDGRSALKLSSLAPSAQISDDEIHTALLVAQAKSHAVSDGSVNFTITCNQSGTERLQRDIFKRACKIAATEGITLEITGSKQKAWYAADVQNNSDFKGLKVTGISAPDRPGIVSTALSGLGNMTRGAAATLGLVR